MKKRIWFRLIFLFVMAGTISCFFNVWLEGAYPVVQFFSGGFLVALIYGLFTFILCICKKHLRTPVKVFISIMEIFCIFGAMGCTSIILTKNEPALWMYLVWLNISIFIGSKSYMDAKVSNF